MDKVLPNAEIKAIIETEYELVPLGRERHGTARRYAFADGTRRDRLHLPRDRAVLRRLQPHPPDRRGDAAHLPVLDARDRPARAAARRARATTSSSRSCATPSGARSSSTTSASPASSSRRARCRGSAGEPCSRSARPGSGSRRPAPRRCRWSASRWPPRPGGSRREDARSAVDLPPFDRSAMDGYAVRAADTDPPRRWRWRARSPRARSRPRRWRRGPRSGSRPAPRCPTAPTRSCASRTRAVEGDARDARAARSSRGLHVRYRGEDVARGDVLAPAGHARSASSASPRWPRPASARSPCTAARSCTCSPPGPSCSRSARRPSRAGSTSPTGSRCELLAERAGAEVVVHPVVPDDPGATRAAVEAGARRRRAARLRRRVGRAARPRQARAARRAASRRSSGACGSSPASRSGSGAAARRSCSGCPGNPLSTVACFLLFVGPALRRLQGEADAAPPFVPARLAVPARPADGRTTLLTAAPGARPRRHAGGDADRGPGLAPDRRARRRRDGVRR